MVYNELSITTGNKANECTNQPRIPETPILRILNPRVTFLPEPRSDIKEIVIIRSTIASLSTQCTDEYNHLPPSLLTTIDLQDKYFVSPGLVDIHVHATGGGGEAGFHSRVPEAKLSDLVLGGVTACVGVLGTDTVTRSSAGLLAKMRAIASDGISAYLWVGGYSVPPSLLTQSIKTDLMLVPEVIGVGELAISDHRSSNPSTTELDRIAAEARVAGMCAEKGGVTYFHMGDHKSGLRPLIDLLERTAIPIGNILPTHMDRNPSLLEEGLKWIRERGGRIDFSGQPGTVLSAVRRVLKEPDTYASSVSVSSDAYGSIPVFDDKGNLVSYDYNKPSLLLSFIETLAIEYPTVEQLSLIFAMFTKNPAEAVKLSDHGTIKVNGRADLLVFSCEDQKFVPSIDSLTYVVSGGDVLKSPGYVKHDMFGN